MTEVPIIRIPIDTSEFDRFAASFEEYLSAVKGLPQDWQATHEKISAIAKTMSSSGTSAASAWGDAISLATRYERAIRSSASAQQSLGHATTSASSAIARMERHAKGIATSLFGAVRSLARVATFGIGGGLLGLGGLVFGIDRLADAVLTRQKTALGMGITPGALASWQTRVQTH